MTAIHETAYPRVRSSITEKELVEIYTPEKDELEFVSEHSQNDVTKLGLLLLLKLFQRLGYFPQFEEIPAQIIEYIAVLGDLDDIEEKLAKYKKGESRWKHMRLLRKYFEITPYRGGGEKVLMQAMVNASHTKDIIADIINAGIEKMVKERYELPSFDTLLRSAHEARSKVNKHIYAYVFTTLEPQQKELIKSLFQRDENESQSLWAKLKQEPQRPTTKNMREFIKHLIWLQSFNGGRSILESIPEAKLKRFAEEAKSLDLTHINETKEKKRFTLAISLINVQTAKALDDLTDMFVRRVQHLHTNGRNALAEYQATHQERADYLIELLEKLVTGWTSTEDQEARIKAIGEIIGGNALEILKQCEAHLAHSKNKYIPFLTRFYKSQRSNFFKFIEFLQPKSTSSDKSLEKAIHFLLENKGAKAKEIPVVETRTTNDGVIEEVTLLDLSWIPDKWWQSVANTTVRNTSIKTLNRKYFEICCFSCVMQELKSNDLYIQGGDKFGDYQKQVISWDEFYVEIDSFCEQMGYSANSDTFISHLKSWLQSTIKLTDSTFPSNESVSIKNGELTIKKIKKKPEPPGFKIIDRMLLDRMPELNILDVLSDTEYWLNWTSKFGLISGFETRLQDAKQRYLTTTFCYGCNLGPTQTARSMEGVDRKQVAYINKKHINEEKLLKANVHIINEYNQFKLPKFWGTGKKASADGTKWDVYEQNLLSEYHIRYGGWGGIGYYHVSDTYIALFSTFISCGVWEAVHILDGLIENKSEIRPDTLHADTQGQSETVFALSYLLGIKLMPRIRNWKDLKLYLPFQDLKMKHLENIFSDTIDWELIETHIPDMLRVALSISKGKIRSSTILRKLNTYSRKSKLYFAFRELGRVIRTIFLLNYIADEDLRKMINAATNTSEAWNAFIQWLAFGGHGVISENNREEQRKMIRYNHLVGNLVIFHNVVSMTGVLQNLIKDGFEITEEILSCLSPYRTAHINRFGNYELIDRIPALIVNDLTL